MCLLRSIGFDATSGVRWPRSTNPFTLRLYSFTPRPPIPPLYCHIRLSHCKIPSLDAPDSFTPLQNSFTRRPQFPSLHCKIPSLDALRFLHQARIRGGAWGAHAPPPSSTENIFISNFWTKYAPDCRKMHLKFQRFLGGMPSDPPGAHTCDERTASLSPIPHAPPPFQNPGSAPVHSTAKFPHSTILCVTVISVSCIRRKSQLPSDGHSSDPLRALACAMYVFRWEMLVALIGMGIIDLQTPTYTKPPESPSNGTKS